MKFVHAADFHLGSWREEKLNKLSVASFNFFIDYCLDFKPDFVLISGDLFNSPLPRIDILKLVVERFKELNEFTKIFIIPGSHDSSPTGKTFLAVLESAGLVTNVESLTSDDSVLFSGVKYNDVFIAGIGGRAGMADSQYFHDLKLNPKCSDDFNTSKFKIFMFHTSLMDLFPKFGGIASSDLPKGFDYYAAGHIHQVKSLDNIHYPGPIFPNNFQELAELKHGGFLVYDSELKYVPIELKKVESIDVNGTMEAEQFHDELVSKLASLDLNDKLLLIRLRGKIKKGSYVTQINFKDIFEQAYSKGAYFVMKNTNLLTREEYEKINVEVSSEEDIVKNILDSKINDLSMPLNTEKKKEFVLSILNAFSREKQEGETNDDFEKRLFSETDEVLNKYFNSL